MPRPAGDDPIEQEVVDAGPLQCGGLEPRGDRLGAARELIGRRVALAAAERLGRPVERRADARQRQAELGGERERELGVRVARAPRVEGNRGQLHGPPAGRGASTTGPLGNPNSDDGESIP
jgi:hypothetical protein